MATNTPLFGEVNFLIASKFNHIKGLAYPVSKGEGGYFSTALNKDAIKDGIRQLLLTEKGERPMQPAFGVRLRTKLFEPLDPFSLSELEDDIRGAIRNYEPRINLKTLSVLEDKSPQNLDAHRIIITLNYTFKDAPFAVENLEIIV